MVSKDHQNKGIGTQLITQALEWCKQNATITKIQLTVRTDNVKAISLYKQFNFIIEAELKNDTRINNQYYNVYIMCLY